MGVEDVVRAAGRVPGGAGPVPGARRRGGGGAVEGTRDRVVIGEIMLPGVRRAVGCARSFVRNVAAGHPALDDMVMVASETVANAIAHTASGREGGLVTVVLAVEAGAYRLEVGDDGAAGGRPHVKPEAGAETGRGMRIVDALAERWGFRADGARTVVWAEFPAPPAAERGRGRGRDTDGETPVSGPG
ncbi:ATP-binding protein [Actinomadura sp. B10D3]|uniref:ATP-binding protein n=1 Tax=Actinomadura sp. B10D3 TaxID=3153557 RepID=UPI00325E5534